MLFNSFEFIFLFFPIVTFLYFFLKKKNLNFSSKVFLIIASLFFYSYWNIKFLPLIIFSVIINYFFYLKIFYSKKSFFLILPIVLNIIVLIIFKYTDFLIENTNFIFDKNITKLNLIFPLALSFFTIQQISFLVDSMQRHKKISLIDYSFYITFFPQLIAGPIIFIKNFRNQINSSKTFDLKKFTIGLLIFFIGLTKKTVISTKFKLIVDSGFNLTDPSFLDSLFTTLSFTLQFYFDFSAYSDMALGSALMLNFKIINNFNSPLKSKSIIEFWQRWHISLSNFITNYMYVPFLKNFKKLSNFNVAISTIFIMSIVGIWHGASWMYLMFGLMHGVAIVTNRLWKQLNIYLPDYIKLLITFSFVNISFLVFRSPDYISFKTIFLPLISLESFSLINSSQFVNFKNLIWILVMLAIVFFGKNTKFLVDKFRFNLQYLFLILFFTIIGISNLVNKVEFLYFKF